MCAGHLIKWNTFPNMPFFLFLEHLEEKIYWQPSPKGLVTTHVKIRQAFLVLSINIRFTRKAAPTAEVGKEEKVCPFTCCKINLQSCFLHQVVGLCGAAEGWSLQTVHYSQSSAWPVVGPGQQILVVSLSFSPRVFVLQRCCWFFL